MEFPKIYTHDGETYLKRVFDFTLSQGRVLRFKLGISSIERLK